MKVLEPFSTKPSPSRRAVDFMPPKASEPELGSVIAQAPIFSRVSSDSAQRSFCAIVPRDMMAVGEAKADAHGGHHAGAPAAELDDGNDLEADCVAVAAAGGAGLRFHALSACPRLRRRLLAGDLAREALAVHLVHAEGAHQLAQNVVRRQVTVFEG